MNIIIVNDYAYVNGGAGQIAINTAKLLAKSGEHVVLFTAVGPVADELNRIDNLEVICTEQYDILHTPLRIRAIVQGCWNFKTRKRFKQLLDRYSPENTVIHIHALSKAISTSILPVAKKRKFKVIYHLHDYGIACPNLGFFNYKGNNICHAKALGIKCLVTNCDKRSYAQKCWRVLRQFVQNKIGGLPNNVDCYIYISQFSLNILKPYIKKGKRLEFLPNVVNINKNERIKAENNSVVVFVGRLSPEKNPQIVAEATQRLGWPVLFVGSGPCEDEIRKINPQATITGWKTQTEVSQLLKTARVLVFPSKCYETQGLSVVEALANGIPVIVADECAARDEVDEKKNGVLFRSNDVNDLIEQIMLFKDDGITKEMSIYGFNNYWEIHRSNNDYIDELKKIYIRIYD